MSLSIRIDKHTMVILREDSKISIDLPVGCFDSQISFFLTNFEKYTLNYYLVQNQVYDKTAYLWKNKN